MLVFTGGVAEVLNDKLTKATVIGRLDVKHSAESQTSNEPPIIFILLFPLTTQAYPDPPDNNEVDCKFLTTNDAVPKALNPQL